MITILLYLYTISADHPIQIQIEEQKFVALKPNHERLGNQLYQLASGFGIARKLNRALYYPLADGQGHRLRCYLHLLLTTFPRIGTIFKIIPKHLIEQTNVSFASDENGKRTCCLYDDPTSGNEDKFMCVHIRRTDFMDFHVESDLNSTFTAIKEIASKKGLKNYLIFGDDQKFMRSLAAQLLNDTSSHDKIVRVSPFPEIVDLYISYRICNAFFMSASSSTFGWWLAFFSQNQDSVYYYKDGKPTNDYKLLKDEFQLKSWHRYDG